MEEKGGVCLGLVGWLAGCVLEWKGEMLPLDLTYHDCRVFYCEYSGKTPYLTCLVKAAKALK